MSTLLERITEDLTASMKEKDSFRTGVIRQMIAVIRNKEKAGKTPKVLTDEETVDLLRSEIATRRESAKIYTDAAAPERAAAETAEADLIESYLPKLLPDSEVERLVEEAISETDASSLRDMGKVIALVSSRAAGSASKRTISTIAKAKLS